jgi:hypothetical protein
MYTMFGHSGLLRFWLYPSVFVAGAYGKMKFGVADIQATVTVPPRLGVPDAELPPEPLLELLLQAAAANAKVSAAAIAAAGRVMRMCSLSSGSSRYGVRTIPINPT